MRRSTAPNAPAATPPASPPEHPQREPLQREAGVEVGQRPVQQIAQVLGRVGGEMIMTDPVVVQTLAPELVIRYAVEVCCAAGVVAAGYLLSRRDRAVDASSRNV